MLPLADLYFQRVAAERREKLGEQLEEARKLRQSIFRRGDLVFSILARCRKILVLLYFYMILVLFSLFSFSSKVSLSNLDQPPLLQVLGSRAIEQFGGFIKEKIRLILETRQHGEVLKGEEEVLKCLMEYSANSAMII